MRIINGSLFGTFFLEDHCKEILTRKRAPTGEQYNPRVRLIIKRSSRAPPFAHGATFVEELFKKKRRAENAIRVHGENDPRRASTLYYCTTLKSVNTRTVNIYRA
jgi:hypothetical protein